MRKPTLVILSALISGVLFNAGIAFADYSKGYDSRHTEQNHHSKKHGGKYTKKFKGKHRHDKRYSHKHRRPQPGELLAPRSFPYALTAKAGKVEVAFKVQLVSGSDNTPYYVILREKDIDHGCDSRNCKKNPRKERDSISSDDFHKLNDAGKNGDRLADDGIYGGTVHVDTKRLKPGDCIVYDAFTVIGKHKIKSPDYSLCVTSFPVGGVDDSNTDPDNTITFDDGSSPAIADELLVRFAPQTNENRIRAIVASVSASVVGSIPPRNLFLIRFPQAQTFAQLSSHINNLRSIQVVESAYLNRIGSFTAIPDDPEFALQHALQWVNTHEAWDLGATGSGVTVTILDSGISAHPDLPVPIGTCGTDTVNHGTSVAGVVSAITDNATGVAGASYDSTLECFVVSSDAAITLAEMVAGFETVASIGTGAVVNASFNIVSAPPPIDLAADDQFDLCASINDVVLNGATPVAVVITAAGNDGSNSNHYPSRCNDDTHVSHAQLTRKDLLIPVLNSCITACTNDTLYTGTGPSNFGPWVDVAAPGTDVRTTNNAAGYTGRTGTSFSAPMVTAAAAQILSCGADVDEIETALISTAPVPVAYPGGSAPRIDVYEALLSFNTAPTGITIDNTSVDENINTVGGFSVGTLSTVDADACDAYTYNIQGGADAAVFSIGGTDADELIITDGVLDFETQASYAVTVRSTDAAGNTFDQAFVISVNDLVEVDSFTIYDVRATYLADLGGATVLTQNFNSFSHNDNLAGVNILPGVTVGSNMSTIIAWDVLLSGDVELFALSRSEVTEDAYYDILVSNTYNAIGFDIDAFNPATPGPGVMEVFFLDGSDTSVNIFPTNATEEDPVFFGVISSQPIIRIRWTEGPEIGGGGGNEETTLDDFAIANLP